MAEQFKNEVEKLKYHLTILLDTETKRPVEDIEPQKISRILDMIEMCDNRTNLDDINKFAEHFNAKYQTNIKPLHQQKKHIYVSRFVKAAACIVFSVFVFLGAEFISVKAFDFSIIQFICATSDRLSFRTDDHNTPENKQTVPSNGYKDYSDLSEMLGFNFYAPDDSMPKDLKLDDIEYNEFSDSIIATYLNGNSYAFWEIILPVGQGTIDFNAQEFKIVEKELSIEDKTVSIYSVKTDDGEVYMATFIYEDILYTLESNLSIEDIITIIKEAKKTNEN